MVVQMSRLETWGDQVTRRIKHKPSKLFTGCRSGGQHRAVDGPWRPHTSGKGGMAGNMPSMGVQADHARKLGRATSLSELACAPVL